MALTKDELRMVISTTERLLHKISNITPSNPMNLCRTAISRDAIDSVVEPCKCLLTETILADKEKDLNLGAVFFDQEVKEIERSIEKILQRISACDGETPQTGFM